MTLDSPPPWSENLVHLNVCSEANYFINHVYDYPNMKQKYHFYSNSQSIKSINRLTFSYENELINHEFERTKRSL